MMEEKKYTPMIRQYLEVKNKYRDTIVLYRLGDFYEMFFDDAKVASSILDLVLTARGKNENAIPMCGVPHHSATSYIQKLVSFGHKVAIVEQLEEAVAGKIVERDVVKIITPGTIFNDEDLKQVNYLVAIYDTKYSFVLLYLDHYSGEMFVKEVQREPLLLQSLLDENVKEIIVRKDFQFIDKLNQIPYSFVGNQFDLSSYQHLNPFSEVSIIQAFELLMQYLLYTQKQSIHHLQPIYKMNDNEYLQMDVATKRHLELTTSTKNKKYSLWGFLDHCNTAMGARKLMQWVEYPLVDEKRIQHRLDVVTQLKDALFVLGELKTQFKNIYDIKRLFSKIAYSAISPKELLKLQLTLQYAPIILENFKTIKDYSHIDTCQHILQKLDEALLSDVSTNIKDGYVFKDTYHEKLAEYRKLQKEGNQYILSLEQKEREKTGIKNLKIGYTRAFGYYIEISKGQMENVKASFGYIRKQTLTTGERYISLELKEIEEKLLSAKEKAIALEIALFEALLEYITTHQQALNELAEVLSEIDCYYALSVASSQFGYVRPTFGDAIEIAAGRHPILETLMKNGQYISNDYSSKENKIMILTGPNMGGKSTYMRQIALICIMAQIGCYVPAKYAQVKILNKIFTRMGASDDILSAQSTFMVEMSEANYALRNADQHSLILFDEIGRGTSTYDGMSLAWAMIEYIQSNIQATTIFSTHYHELTQLEALDQVCNSYVEVLEDNDHVTFLYKVKSGYIEKSYGINVAKLAKLPDEIITRSKYVLSNLHKNELHFQSLEPITKVKEHSKVEIMLQNANVDQMTPLEALLFVAKLKEELVDE